MVTSTWAERGDGGRNRQRETFRTALRGWPRRRARALPGVETNDRLVRRYLPIQRTDYGRLFDLNVRNCNTSEFIEALDLTTIWQQ